MKVSKLILFLVIGLGFGACQKGPTDEQLKDVMSKAHETLVNQDSSFEQNDEKVRLQLSEADGLFDIGKTGARQFGILTNWNTLLRSRSVKNWIAPRLQELSQQADKEGALAAYYRLVYNPERDKSGYSPEETAVFLKHPAAGEVFRDSVLGATLFIRLMGSVAGDQAQKAELFKWIVPHIDDRLTDRQIMASISLFDHALALDTLMPLEDRETLRIALLKQQERLLAHAEAAGDDVEIRRTENNIAYLNSPLALGKLIGGEAPEIKFMWTSGGQARKLSDLKGKVVVLDFWATWCGPCVAAFPNVRELQKRYKDYPVEIVGVTSVQGRHIRRSGDKREKVDTKGNPQQEFDLMKEFMKDMNMTWNVVFSEDNVFNPMYGVNGIPHLTIIDAEGRVRYNGLSPYEAPFHEAEKIDALLKEAGLKFPLQPMATENYVK